MSKLCFLMGDDAETPDIFLGARLREWEDAPVIAIEYDFLARREIAGQPILAPMDVVPQDLPDQIFRDYYDWQQALPAMVLPSGQSLYDASGIAPYEGGTEGWIVRVGNIMHVRMRFVAFVIAVMQRYEPSVVCAIGFPSAQPWAARLLDQILEAKFPQVERVAPSETIEASARLALWSATQSGLERERESREERVARMLNRLRNAESLAEEDLILRLDHAETTLADLGFDRDGGLETLRDLNNQIRKLENHLSKAGDKLQAREKMRQELSERLDAQSDKLAKLSKWNEKLENRVLKTSRKLQSREKLRKKPGERTTLRNERAVAQDPIWQRAIASHRERGWLGSLRAVAASGDRKVPGQPLTRLWHLLKRLRNDGD